MKTILFYFGFTKFMWASREKENESEKGVSDEYFVVSNLIWWKMNGLLGKQGRKCQKNAANGAFSTQWSADDMNHCPIFFPWKIIFGESKVFFWKSPSWRNSIKRFTIKTARFLTFWGQSGNENSKRQTNANEKWEKMFFVSGQTETFSISVSPLNSFY